MSIFSFHFQETSLYQENSLTLTKGISFHPKVDFSYCIVLLLEVLCFSKRSSNIHCSGFHNQIQVLYHQIQINDLNFTLFVLHLCLENSFPSPRVLNAFFLVS